MTELYTPSTVRVRQVWEEFAEMKGSTKYPDELFAEFDRWLAAHDADVKAEAWDAAIESAYQIINRRNGTYEAGIDLLAEPNPYREVGNLSTRGGV